MSLKGALLVATMMCGTCRISVTALKSFKGLNFALGYTCGTMAMTPLTVKNRL